MKLDVYVWQARRSAVLLTALPPALAMLAWFPKAEWALLAAPLTFFGIFALVAQIGRDKGKMKEPWLFASWGGKPTTVLLRHRSSPIEPGSLERLHSALARATGVEAPSKRKEAGSPDNADKVYEEYVRYLRDSTRDRDRYPAVFAENVNYGFRRNLWGLKPIGIVIAALATVAAAVAACWHHGHDCQPLAVAAAAVNLLMLVAWLFWITPGWVRIAGQAYAERLIEVGLRDARPEEAAVGPPGSNTS